MKTHDTARKPVINVCLMQPPGYIHALALLEAAEYVTEKSILAGYAARLSKNRLVADGLNIVFGAHIHPRESLSYPPNTVIFNPEQVPEKRWINSQYKDCLDRHFVWDYSQFNIELLGHQRTQRIDFYHVDKLRRINPDLQREYDLIFYGSLNDRRKAIIEKLRSRGLKILTVFGLYGAERDALLGKARAVLNLHFYESQIFQQIRSFYALSNSIPVISENFPAASAPAIYGEVIFTPGREPFEDFVTKLLAPGGRFEAESKEKIARFHASGDNTEFNHALETTVADVLGGPSSAASAKPRAPARINLGSGRDYRPGYLNIDIDPDQDPDGVIDLSAPMDLPVSIPSPTYGDITLDENQVDEIVAIDFLGQVRHLPRLMGNCLKLLREGGKFTIQVHYELSLGAWQDPAHVRAFNETSWLYYTDRFWSLGWFSHRFDCTETGLNLSEFGKQLVEQNVPQEEVLRTPRAIDSMKIVLTKRRTTPEEKTAARAYSSGFIASQ